MFWVKNGLKNRFLSKKLNPNFSIITVGRNLGKSDDTLSDFFFQKNLGRAPIAKKKIRSSIAQAQLQ
jgi:hypothetical protein